MALPLKAPDLAAGDVFAASFAGAHTFVDMTSKKPGIPTLRYRQFSDWVPGGPLLDPAVEIRVIGEDGKPLETETLQYVWRPDFVRWRTKYGNVAESQQILAYVDEETVLCEIKIKSLSGKSIQVQATGSVTDKVKANITKLTDKGFSVQMRGELWNAWEAPASKLDISYTVAFSETPSHLLAEDRDYTAEFRVSGTEQHTMTVVLTGKPTKGRLASLLSEPSRAISRTTSAVNSWLAQVEKPQLKDVHAVKMYYNSWYQFWYNTEHAEGLWSRPIITPSKSSYGRGIWLWDSAFHVFALLRGRNNALQLAEDQVRVLVEGAKHVGHLPREVWVAVANPEIQPPGILTWSAMEIYKRTGNKQFLEDIYPTLASNNEWFYKERDSNNNGLCEWEGGDSGWDTNPRWDGGAVDAVDLNSWLYQDQLLLADMCDILGKKNDAAKWNAKAESTAALIRDKMWDEESGCFWDLNPETGEMVKVLTPAIYWPMFAGIATKEQAEALVKRLEPGEGLWTEYPMPCVSEKDPAFNPTDYWRGPVWINLNWITCLGLEKYGYNDLAKKLRDKSIEVIVKNPVPREYYDPRNGDGLGAENFTWTGALLIIMCGEAAS